MNLGSVHFNTSTCHLSSKYLPLSPVQVTCQKTTDLTEFKEKKRKEKKEKKSLKKMAKHD